MPDAILILRIYSIIRSIRWRKRSKKVCNFVRNGEKNQKKFKKNSKKAKKFF